MTGPATAILAAIVIAGSVAALAVTDQPNTISGQAEAIDGDTLHIGGALRLRLGKGTLRVRLAEIDAPEHDQMCQDAQGHPWACGQASTAAMRYMLSGDPYVTCAVKSHDRYGRAVAACKNGEGDLGGRLVALGLAIVYPRYSVGTYDDQQSAAKADHAGMWSGTFTPPWEYRHQR